MKLRKKILITLSVLPLLWLAFYCFTQQPNFCTRGYSESSRFARKYSFCKISDDYLKINKPEAKDIVKSYEYAYFNEEYNKLFARNIFPIDRQVLLFQDSWYWNDVYNNVKNNLENDVEYRETLLWYLEYGEHSYSEWKVWVYKIKWDTEEERYNNRSWFNSTFNTISENLAQQIDEIMPTYKLANFAWDIIKFICIVLALVWISFFSIKAIKNTKSIRILLSILIFDCLIFCCCFDLFNEIPNTFLTIINILLGIALIWISVIAVLKTLKNESMDLCAKKEHSEIYNNVLWILKILMILIISIIYLAGIDVIFLWWDSWMISWEIWLFDAMINVIWLWFDIYISYRLIKFIKTLKIKKVLCVILISVIIISFICKFMTIWELYTYEIIYILSFIFCILNIAVYVPWVNSKLIGLNKYLVNLAPKIFKKINEQTGKVFG